MKSFRKGTLIAVLFLFASSVAGAAPGEQKTDKNQSARMGSATLTFEEVMQGLSQKDAATRHKIISNPELLKAFVRDGVIRKYLFDQAKKDKLEKNDQVKNLIEQARQQILVSYFIAEQAGLNKTVVSDDEIRAFYEKNKEKIRKPDQLHIAQIYLKFPENVDHKSLVAYQKEVIKLHQELVESPDRFAKLAKERSHHLTSAPDGGDMGWSDESQLIPEFIPVVLSMEEGDISPPLATSTGWHILKLLGRKSGGAPDFSEAREKISRLLVKEAVAKKEQEFLAGLTAKNPPQVPDALIKKVVQGGQQ